MTGQQYCLSPQKIILYWLGKCLMSCWNDRWFQRRRSTIFAEYSGVLSAGQLRCGKSGKGEYPRVRIDTMIIFDLQCICGCQFEGWFDSRDDFDRQHAEGAILCPDCGSDRIHKILSPVSIRSRSQSTDTAPPLSGEGDSFALQFLHAFQDFVEQNFEDVGAKLTEESLKMHYGVEEPRNIRGVTTADQEKMLQDEGIELLKVPLRKKGTDSKLN